MFFSENGKIIDSIEGMSGSVEYMSSICKILGFSPAKPGCSDAAGQVERLMASDAYGTGGRRVEGGARGVHLQSLVWWQMGSPS